jgi:Helix-turn-helix domain
MAQAARKLTAKDANEKLAHRRRTVLGLAERLGDATEARRRGGIDRTSFYDWKRRFRLQGLDGLKDLPPIARSHPMTTAPEVAARIEELALARPAHGCNQGEAPLALEGRRVSAITIQKILGDSGLGARHERWLALERRNAERVIELSSEQAAFLEKLNPCSRERDVESGRRASSYAPTPSSSAASRASARPTCTPWWTDTHGSYAVRLPAREQAAGSGRGAIHAAAPAGLRHAAGLRRQLQNAQAMPRQIAGRVTPRDCLRLRLPRRRCSCCSAPALASGG